MFIYEMSRTFELVKTFRPEANLQDSIRIKFSKEL